MPALAPEAFTNGSAPTLRVERTPAGVRTPDPGAGWPASPAPVVPLALGLAAPVPFGAVTPIGADAVGSGLTFVPTPVTVRFTDRTEVAVAAMCTWAWKVFLELVAVPTEYGLVPFLMNWGFWLDRDVASLRLTPSMVPFSDQTLTFHSAERPRVTLAASARRLTHSFAGLVAPPRTRRSRVAAMGSPSLSRVTTPDAVAEEDALAVTDDEVEGDADADDVADGSAVGEGDGAAEGLVLALGVGLADALPDGLGLADLVELGLGLADAPGEVTASHFWAKSLLTASVRARMT